MKTAMLFAVNYFSKVTLTVFDDNLIPSKLREHRLSMWREKGRVFKLFKIIGARARIFMAR